MEKFSYILATYLVQKGVIVADKSCIYQYGFQVGLEVSINTAISILIAVLCHMERETLVFFAVFIVLRSYLWRPAFKNIFKLFNMFVHVSSWITAYCEIYRNK